MKTDEIKHDGHRLRLTELIDNVGIEKVSNIQAVEFFLTYIFPRGDVNPLAHSLLNRYGNFGNIIDASVNDLMKVKGISKQSARKIHLFTELINYYTYSKLSKKTSLKNTSEFLDYIEQLMRIHTTETLYLFAIDNGFNLTQIRKNDLKQIREVGLQVLEIYDFIYSSKLSYIAVAHNHPGGSAMSSDDDDNAVAKIQEIAQNVGCQFIDSFIIGNDGIYSQRQESFLRRFETLENLFNWFDIKK